MTRPTWLRRPYGWAAADAAVFLERGARMSDGGTAWLVWYRIPDSEVTVDEFGAYETARGVPVRRLCELTGRADDSVCAPGWYAHRNDAGSLAEAKITAARLSAPDETPV